MRPLTVPVGESDGRAAAPDHMRGAGFRQSHAGGASRISSWEIGRVIEREVRRSGFSVIRDLGGHGIGRTIHEEPRVPNYADPGGQSSSHRRSW